MAMPSIEDIIPEGPIRKRVYQAGAVVGGLLFLTQVGFVAAQVAYPTWLTVALAIYAPLAAAGFAKAQANTPSVPVAPLLLPKTSWTAEERAAQDALDAEVDQFNEERP